MAPCLSSKTLTVPRSLPLQDSAMLAAYLVFFFAAAGEGEGGENLKILKGNVEGM